MDRLFDKSGSSGNASNGAKDGPARAIAPLLSFLRKAHRRASSGAASASGPRSSAVGASSELDKSAASASMAARFAKLREQLEARMGTKSSRSRKRRARGGRPEPATPAAPHSNRTATGKKMSPFTIVDLLQQHKTNATGAVLVSRATNPKLVARFLEVLQRLRNAGRTSIAAICVLVPHSLAAANTDWRNLVQERDFFYVVVPEERAPDGSGPDPSERSLVWYVGAFKSKASRSGGMRALIDASVTLKRQGKSFPKIAKDWARLTELVCDDGGSSSSSSSSMTSRRVDHLFSRTPAELRAQIRMDNTATFSVTDERTADEITEHALALIGGAQNAAEYTIIDLTACVGGNALSFAKRFPRVLGIEFDSNRANMLDHNMRLLENVGEARKRCQLRCQQGDAVQLLSNPAQIRADAVCGWRKSNHEDVGLVFFLDPPWGGLNYKDAASLRLKLGGKPISEVLAMCLDVRGCAHIIMKCPFNTDMSGIDALVGQRRGRCSRTHWSLSKRVKCVVISVANFGGLEEPSAKRRKKVSAPRESHSSQSSQPKAHNFKKKSKKKKKKKKKSKKEQNT